MHHHRELASLTFNNLHNVFLLIIDNYPHSILAAVTFNYSSFVKFLKRNKDQIISKCHQINLEINLEIYRP